MLQGNRPSLTINTIIVFLLLFIKKKKRIRLCRYHQVNDDTFSVPMPAFIVNY